MLDYAPVILTYAEWCDLFRRMSLAAHAPNAYRQALKQTVSEARFVPHGNEKTLMPVALRLWCIVSQPPHTDVTPEEPELAAVISALTGTFTPRYCSLLSVIRQSQHPRLHSLALELFPRRKPAPARSLAEQFLY